MNLSKFGYRELGQAAELLESLSNANFQNEEAKDTYQAEDFDLEYNPDSDTVFLSSESGEILMLNTDNKIEKLVTCANCGNDGLPSDGDINLSAEGFCRRPACQEAEKNN